MTHADQDHIWGFLKVLDKYEKERFYWNGARGTTKSTHSCPDCGGLPNTKPPRGGDTDSCDRARHPH